MSMCQKTLTTALIVLASCLSQPGAETAEADVILRVQDVEVVAGESGYFDVCFEITGDSSANLAGYQIELYVDDNAGVTFTGFGEADNAVFPGQTPLQTPGATPLPGTRAAANDFLLAGENPIADGAGLLRVYFDTAPDLDNTSVEVEFDSYWSMVIDSSLGSVLSGQDPYVSGTIAVSAVPEPSTFCITLSLATLVCAFRRRTA